MRQSRSLAGVLLLVVLNAPASSALVLGIPPATPLETTVLESFAAGLAQQLAEPVELETGSNWRQFRAMVRGGKIDLVFAAPHLVAWLIEHEAWSPLVRIEDELHFIVVTSRPANDIFEIGDLVGRQVCTPLAPELGNLVLFNQFPNRNRQPLSREIPGGREALLSLADEGCDAVVIIESIYNSAPTGLTESLTLLMKSTALDNYGFATRLESVADKIRLTEALTSDEIQDVISPLLLQFSSQDKLVLPGEEDHTSNLSDLLSGFWD